MQRSYLPLSIGLIGLSCTLLSGCDALSKVGIGVTPINEVLQNPSKYKQEVTLRGEVTNQFSVLGKGLYQLKDKSGGIWVWSSATMPAMNSTITVRGGAREGITLAGQSYATTLAERERF